MRCDWVEDRLVAWQDGELSPGETTLVTEHLASCAACADLEASLGAVTPAPWLAVPPEVLARMHAAVDRAVAQAEVVPPPRRAPTRRWTRWLRRDRELSNGQLLAYGVLLAACLGWGISNWLAVRQLQLDPARPAHTASVDEGARRTGSAIPGDQYQPASFSPAEEAEAWR